MKPSHLDERKYMLESSILRQTCSDDAKDKNDVISLVKTKLELQFLCAITWQHFAWSMGKKIYGHETTYSVKMEAN